MGPTAGLPPTETLALLLIAVALAPFAYAYGVYPLALRLLAAARPLREVPPMPAEWPSITITVPVYNEAAQVRGLVESLLALDYPADRRQILIISDASTDGTDEVVREYADRGVELLRMPRRGGKTAAENASAAHARGEIVVNTDASIRIRSDALKPLIAAFGDPEVGVASGRDVSVARIGADPNAAEAGYVDYEMRIRALETRAGGIIGASGCFFATRADLHGMPLPEHLSRDFAAALVAREQGYRSVSVDGAVCYVPRTSSLQREYRRKVRTISRGMETLAFKRHLLNPFRHGLFAWMLWSHKVARWMVPCALLTGAAGLALLTAVDVRALPALVLAMLALVAAVVGWYWPAERPLPRVLALPTGVALVAVATAHALFKAVKGDEDPTWEPTRRELVVPPTSAAGG